MSDLVGQPAEISFTLTITRAATGEVINIPMVGRINHEATPETLDEKEPQHGNDPSR